MKCNVSAVIIVLLALSAHGIAGQTTTKSSEPLSWQFRRDDSGRVTGIVDPAGRETRLEYDFEEGGKAGTITRHLPDGAGVRYRYNRFGRRIQMADGQGSVDYQYDELGRLTAAIREDGPAVALTYDTAGRVTSVRVGDGPPTGYSYGYLGRLAEIDTPAGKISYRYQTGRRMIIRTLPNGIRTVWEYRVDGNLGEISHVAQDNHILLQFSYAYRADGRIGGITELSERGRRSRQYRYDGLGRLIGVRNSSGPDRTYRYNRRGNRTGRVVDGRESQSGEYDWAGRLVRLDDAECAHDGTGNLTAYPDQGRDRRFEFNGGNRLRSARTEAGGVEYEYDGDGNMVARTVGEERTTFVPDPLAGIWRPLLAKHGGDRKTFYVWNGDVPLAEIEGEEVRFFLHDHLGSVRLVVGEDGSIVDRRSFSAFGIPQHKAGDMGLSPGFAGLFYDPVGEVHPTRARAYDPSLGRFLQRDPQFRAPTVSDLNTSAHVYCQNDPVNYVDIDGARRQHYFSRLVSQSVNSTLSFLKDMRDWMVAKDTPTSFENAIRDAVRNTPRNGTIPILVTGVSNNWSDAQNAAQTHLGERGIGIRSATGNFLWDAGVAFRDQTQGATGSLMDFPLLATPPRFRHADDTTTHHNIVWHAEYVQQMAEDMGRDDVTFDIHAHSNGAINLRNESQQLRRAIAGGLKVNSVTTYAVSSTEPLQQVCQQLGVPFDTKLHPHDPIVDLTQYPRTVSQDLQTDIGLPRWIADPIAFGMVETNKVASLLTLPWTIRHHSLGTPDGYSIDVTGQNTAGKGSRTLPLSDIRLPALYDIQRLMKKRDDFVPFPPDDGGGGPGGGGSLSPSNVGGIYLHGAGEALAGLGRLKGVALDEKNGKLILLSEGHTETDLPPLRLDDVVTVFRSVYEHGRAPYVSIDPNPKDPRGPRMLIRHDEGTAGTYVGWTLFEADRVMKCYSLGFDNVTRRPVESKVEDYRNLLDLGFSGTEEARRAPVWERFWIVPSEVTQRRAADRLTLFDVPLKVRTQRMVLRDSKLVPAPDDTPSEQAQKFSAWFTAHYDEIAAEAKAVPPEGSGIESARPFFTELRRIALITAIAERLRDQGVPMPPWMRNYAVAPCPMPETTPAITVTATKTETRRVQQGIEKTTHEQRIFGGVDLAADQEEVEVLPTDQPTRELVPAVRKALCTAPALKSVDVERDGDSYRALALPGKDTVALGPCRLRETDLSVPTRRGHRIELVRKFNSFFQPRENLGKAWTLDLPYLAKERLPVRRGDDRQQYRSVYELSSPLGSCSESFRRRSHVEELDGEILVPSRSRAILGLVKMKNEKIGKPTMAMLFRDGQQWHFDEDGYLVGRVRPPAMVLYRRDGAHRIRRIEGWYGANLRADIRLKYGDGGRLVEASGSNGETVAYRYADGKLVGARGKTTTTYEYEDALVSSVTRNGRTVRQFGYEGRGRLAWERRYSGPRVSYSAENRAEGLKIVASTESTTEMASYDDSARPGKRILRDGTRIKWSHGPGEASEASVIRPDGTRHRVRRSEDGREVSWTGPTGATRTARYDNAGRPARVAAGGSDLLRNQWHRNGLLEKTTTDTCAFHPRYRSDGVQTALLITPPQEAGPGFSRWKEEQYDELGRTARITDSAGLEVVFGYEDTGQSPSAVAWKWRDGQAVVQRERGADGRLKSIKTNWGRSERRTYDARTGQIEKVTIENAGQRASVRYENGRPAAIRHFDGNTWKLDYYESGRHKALCREIRAPHGVRLHYEYDDADRLSEVTCRQTSKTKYEYDRAGRLTSIALSPVQR